MQLYALWYGMAYLNANYDNTFNDSAKIWIEGSGEAITPTDPALLVSFADPFNNRTYQATRLADPNLVSLGAAMLSRANAYLRTTTQRWQTPTQTSTTTSGGSPTSSRTSRSSRALRPLWLSCLLSLTRLESQKAADRLVPATSAATWSGNPSRAMREVSGRQDLGVRRQVLEEEFSMDRQERALSVTPTNEWGP